MSGQFLVMSVTTIHADFFSFNRSDNGGEFIGFDNVFLICTLRSLIGLLKFDLISTIEHFDGILNFNSPLSKGMV